MKNREGNIIIEGSRKEGWRESNNTDGLDR